MVKLVQQIKQVLFLIVDRVAKCGVDIDLVNHRIISIPIVMKAILTFDIFFRGDVGETYEFTVWKNVVTIPVQIVRVNREDYILNSS